MRCKTPTCDVRERWIVPSYLCICESAERGSGTAFTLERRSAGGGEGETETLTAEELIENSKRMEKLKDFLSSDDDV